MVLKVVGFIGPSGTGKSHRATWVAAFAGLAMIGTSLWATMSRRPFSNWMDMSRGILLVPAPWIIGYSSVRTATINDVTVGVAIILLAIVQVGAKLLPKARQLLAQR
jgi:hypothetical protein